MPSSAPPTTSILPLSLHDALPIYLAAAGAVQVHRLTPRGVVRVGEVRAELPQVVPRGSEVVVDHVQAHRQAQTVRAVHERLQRLRRSEEHTSELQSRGHLVCRLLLPRPPPSSPFPYTTLFRSTSLLPGPSRFTA